MPRGRPEDRLDRLIECAAGVFTARGYRRTQMADVAKAMGIAPGTVYLYVDSKEALFDLVVQRAFRAAPPGRPPGLPVHTPGAGALLTHVRERFAREAALPALKAALRTRKPADARAEMAAVVRELYAMMARNRRGMQLLERSALDRPELAGLFFQRLRRGLIERLTAYLQRRMDQGVLRRVPHVAVAARLILETVAWFAMHRHGDREPAAIDEQSAEETVVDALVNAFARR